MADPGIGRVALVVIVDGLVGVAEEDGVAVWPARLQAGYLVVALGDAVGQSRLGGTVIGVDLLTKDAAFQGACGLTHLLDGQAGGRVRIRQESRLSVAGEKLLVCWILEIGLDLALFQESTVV